MTEFSDEIEAAETAAKQGRRDEAFQIGRKLLASSPELGDEWGRVAQTLTLCADWIGALNARKKQVEANPKNYQAGFHFVTLASDCGLHSLALNMLDQLMENAQPNPIFLSYKGWILSQLGEFEEAVEAYNAARDVDDTIGGPWFWQSKLGRIPHDDETFAWLKDAIERDIHKDSMNMVQLNFALARMLDKRGDQDGAFKVYNRAANEMASETPYQEMQAALVAKRTFVNFDEDLMLNSGPGHDSDRPIFVAGMPRSGTTLMQQLLTTDPSVTSGGEVSLLSVSVSPFRDMTLPHIERYFEEAKQQGVGPWRRLGRAYSALSAERFGETGRFVDKQIGNSQILGLAMAALPNASFIWMRRNPPACAFSIFSNIMSRGINWSWRLEDIALQMRLTERALQHWKSIFGDRLLIVDYEDLARDPESQVQRAFAHCGLTPTEDTLNFHQQKSAIATSSIAQVREPIRADKLDSWKRFEPHLEPFFEAYERAGKMKLGIGDES